MAGTQIETPDGKMGAQIPFIYEVDFDFIPTYHIPLVAGRVYSRAFLTDSAQSMVINEAAARLYGYQHPADAVGKKFDQWGRKGVIIGVVKDFNFRSLHQEVQPLTLRYGYPYSLNRLSVELKGDNISVTLSHLRSTWNRIAPQRPFLYHFLNQSFGEQYQADQQFGNLFTFFSCLSIFIACLGLFGLSAFMAQQRVKEIGIRKVLGSSQAGIVMLLSRKFYQARRDRYPHFGPALLVGHERLAARLCVPHSNRAYRIPGIRGDRPLDSPGNHDRTIRQSLDCQPRSFIKK